MKKLYFISFYFIAFILKSQIVFEHLYDTASTVNNNIGGINAEDQLMIVNFEVSGMQYVKVNRHGSRINIYDLNHVLTKTISISGLPSSNYGINYKNVLYLSQQLFNTDNKIEFMYSVPQPSTGGGAYYTGIYDEDGNLLFSDTGTVTIFPNVPLQQYPIYNTSNGTKMILSYSNGQAKVFSLAGTLSTAIQQANSTLASAAMLSNARPNPTSNAATIEYALPQGVNSGDIIFYDTQGVEIKRFKVDNTFDHLLISTSDIPAGTYYYQLQTAGKVSEGKKMVVIK